MIDMMLEKLSLTKCPAGNWSRMRRDIFPKGEVHAYNLVQLRNVQLHPPDFLP